MCFTAPVGFFQLSSVEKWREPRFSLSGASGGSKSLFSIILVLERSPTNLGCFVVMSGFGLEVGDSARDIPKKSKKRQAER